MSTRLRISLVAIGMLLQTGISHADAIDRFSLSPPFAGEGWGEGRLHRLGLAENPPHPDFRCA
jgi:hypothetical protein